MSLDLYTREDIANILRSVRIAEQNTTARAVASLERQRQIGTNVAVHEIERDMAIFDEGFYAATVAFATAVGLAPGSIGAIAAQSRTIKAGTDQSEDDCDDPEETFILAMVRLTNSVRR